MNWVIGGWHRVGSNGTKSEEKWPIIQNILMLTHNIGCQHGDLYVPFTCFSWFFYLFVE